MYMEQPRLKSLSRPGVYGVFPQQILQLKCTINGSVLSWRSNEYLNGDRGELALTLGHTPGHREAGDGIEALLEAINGSTIYSTLRIVVSALHPNFTVSCFNKDSGRISSMTFYLIGEFSIIEPMFN